MTGFRKFLRQAVSGLVYVGILLLIVAGVCLLVWLSYYLWSVNHPDAPWWGFLLHRK